jgi:hypothetical protein
MAEIVDIGATGGYSYLAGAGLCDVSGTVVPSDGTDGYAHGCIFRHVDGTSATDAIYINISTEASCDFDPITVALASSLFTTTLRPYAIPLNTLRIWNDFDSFLPETAATDDIGITEGAYGTDAPSLTSIDFKATSTEAFGRVQVPVPADYVAGQPITVVVDAICDSTNPPSVNADGGEKTFTITPTNVVPGDILDIRVEVDGEDADGTDPAYTIVISALTVNFTTKIPV